MFIDYKLINEIKVPRTINQSKAFDFVHVDNNILLTTKVNDTHVFISILESTL